MSDESTSLDVDGPASDMPAAAKAVRGAILESLAAELPDDHYEALESTAPVFALHRAASLGLAWIACQDPRKDVRDRASEVFFAHLEAVERGSATYRKVERQALRYCRDSLRDPDLGDLPKLEVLDFFHALTLEELTPEQARQHFQDYDAALRDRFVRLAASQPDTAGGLAALLLQLDLSPDGSPGERKEAVERLHAWAHACSEAAPQLAATLLVWIAGSGYQDGYSPRRMFAALDAAIAASPQRALWALTAIGSWPSTEGFGLRVRELALRLRSEGVQASAPSPGTFLRAATSRLERNGHRDVLAVFARSGDGAECALRFSISDTFGLTQVDYLALVSPKALAPPLTPCDEVCVRDLVADGLAKTEAADLWPPAGMLLASALWVGLPTEPQKREPCLAAYDFEAIAPLSSEDDAAECVLEPPFAWPFGCDQAYEYVQVWLGGRLDPVEASAVTELLAILDQHGERERLIARLEANLEVEALAGRAGEESCQFAARVLRTLREGLRPWTELHCVRQLAQSTLENLDLAVSRRIFSDEAFEAERRLGYLTY